jgi:predicted dehydrogenase
MSRKTDDRTRAAGSDRTLAVIGAAHVHLSDHLAAARDCGWRVAALWDHDSDRRERWADRAGAAQLADLKDLRAVGADAALVCSETARRAGDVGAALEAGLPVYSEKPLGPDAAVAARLADAAQGRPCAVGFALRSMPALAQLAQAVREGAVGRPVEAQARYAHDGAFANWLDLSGWMTDPAAAAVGGFGDEAIHALDVLLWLFGEPDRAVGVVGEACGLGVDDHGAGVLAWPGGLTATLRGGWTDMGVHFELEVVGTEGVAAAALRGDAHGSVWLRRRGETAPHWRMAGRALDAGDGLRAFLRRLDGDADAPPVADFAAGAAASRWLDRLYGRAGGASPQRGAAARPETAPG